MEILLANHSSYPRIGNSAHQQRLRRAQAAHERGEIDDAALVVVERSVIAEVVAEQAATGIDLVTDGQVRWPDPVSHLMAPLPGVRLNGLLRFFDTNFYYRQPVITGRLARHCAGLAADFRHACSASSRPLKPVLTGPYTLARLSVIATDAYAHFQDLAVDLSTIIAAEVRELAEQGAAVIQIDEPAICMGHADDIRLLRQLFEPIYEARGEAQIAIATYFADADPFYPQLNSVAADIVALDLSTTTALDQTIASAGAAKILALGVVDGRDSRLEDPQAVARRLERLLRRYTIEAVYLQPSCGLEFLPRDRARAKLERLVAIRAALCPEHA